MLVVILVVANAMLATSAEHVATVFEHCWGQGMALNITTPGNYTSLSQYAFDSRVSGTKVKVGYEVRLMDDGGRTFIAQSQDNLANKCLVGRFNDKATQLKVVQHPLSVFDKCAWQGKGMSFRETGLYYTNRTGLSDVLSWRLSKPGYALYLYDGSGRTMNASHTRVCAKGKGVLSNFAVPFPVHAFELKRVKASQWNQGTGMTTHYTSGIGTSPCSLNRNKLIELGYVPLAISESQAEYNARILVSKDGTRREWGNGSCGKVFKLKPVSFLHKGANVTLPGSFMGVVVDFCPYEGNEENCPRWGNVNKYGHNINFDLHLPSMRDPTLASAVKHANFIVQYELIKELPAFSV